MMDSTEDGRVARGHRTREAVIEALYDLFAEGSYTPTLQELATRAGRTPRAIYHHFADLDAVVVSLAEEQMRRHARLFVARPVEGTRSERVDGIVAHRAELFEVVAPARRAALAVMHSSPALRARQTHLAAHLRQQLERTFEPELLAFGHTARAEALDLLDLHTSWETWDRLRTWQNLSVDRTRALLIRLVAATLEG